MSQDPRLDALLSELPEDHPVPPGLDAAVLRRMDQVAPRSAGPARPALWWLAAAALLGGLLGAAALSALRPPPVLHLQAGSQTVHGHARLLAGDRTIEIDGRARIDVAPPAGEPEATLARGAGQEEPAMKLPHLAAAALAGSLVTVAVYEGTALISDGADGRPLVVRAGEQRVVGPTPAPPSLPPSVRPSGPAAPGPASAAAEQADARVAALEAEVASLRAQQALTEGQLSAVRGEPRPWPDDIASAYLPDAFERSLQAFVDEEGAGEVLTIDCAEFPCLAVLRPDGWEGDGVPPAVQAVVDRMKEVLGEDTGVAIHNAKTANDGQELLLTGLGFAPKDIADDDLQHRASWRMEGHLRGLSDELLGEPADGPGGRATEDVDVD